MKKESVASTRTLGLAHRVHIQEQCLGSPTVVLRLYNGEKTSAVFTIFVLRVLKGRVR